MENSAAAVLRSAAIVRPVSRSILATSIASFFRSPQWRRLRCRDFAAAVAAACGLALAGASTPAHGGTYTGAIDVFDVTTNTDLGFISGQNAYGEYATFNTNIASAVQFTFTTGGTPFSISLVTPGSNASYPYFGLIQGYVSSDANIGVGNSNYLFSNATTLTSAGSTPSASGNSAFANNTSIAEDVESTVWSLSGNTLTAQWINTDGSKPTTIAAYTQGILIFTGDVSAFARDHGAADVVVLKLNALPGNHWLGQTDGTWTGNNWASDAAGTPTQLGPGSSDDVVFSATGAAHQNTTLGADFTIHSLTINDAAAVTIGGSNTLTVSGGGITVNSGAGLFTINSSLTLAGASNTITVSNSAGAVINGVISGSIGLTKAGTGTLSLFGTNTYTGGTTITGGTVIYSHDAAFGDSSGVLTLNGGTIEGNAGNADIHRAISLGTNGGTIETSGTNTQIGLYGVISGNGPLNLSSPTAGGAAMFFLGTADNTFTGLTTVETGQIELSAPGHIALSGNVQVNPSGILVLNASEQIVDTATVTVNGKIAFNTGASNVQETIGTLNGSVSGTVLNFGTGVASLIVSGGTFGGSIFGPVMLTKQGTGTLTLSGTGSFFTGGVNINAGVLSITNSGAVAGTGNTINIAAGAELNAAATLTLANQVVTPNTGGNATISAAPGAILTLDFANFNASNAVFGSAGNTGTVVIGPLTGGASTTSNGTIEVAYGTLQNGGGPVGLSFFTSGEASTTVDSGATLDIHDNNLTVKNLLGIGNVTLGSSSSTVLTLQNGTFGGAISGAGQLVLNGPGNTFVLSGTNTYTGATDIKGGTLRLDGSLGNTTVTVENTATLIGKGSITGSVTMTSGSTLAPGDGGVGTLAVGPLTLNAGSNTNFDLGAPGIIGGTSSDLLKVSGNLSLGGTFNFANAGGFGPGGYQLIQYSGSLSGVTPLLGTLPAGFGTPNMTIVTGVAHEIDLIVVPNAGAATTQFWDGPNTTSNNAIDGGTGTWSNFSSNFTNASGSTNSVWQNGIAIFSTPSNNEAASTVTVSGAVSFAGLMFTGGNYTINSDGVAGSGLTAVGLPTNTTNIASISVSNGVTAAINAAIGGTGGISKDGAGRLVLGGTNTYTGGTTINTGTLAISSDSNLGAAAGVVTLNGGTLETDAPLTVNHAITLGTNGGTITNTVTSNFVQIDGKISGTGPLTLNGSSTFGLSLNGSVDNDFTGATEVKSGFVYLNSGHIMLPGDVTVDAGTSLISLESQQIASTATATINGSLDLVNTSGIQQTFAVLKGSGNVTAGGVSGTLTVGSGLFSGLLQENGGGQLSLTKQSTGTLTLTGTNTYTGATDIQGGTLQVDGSLGNTAVTVENTATLAGKGSITGGVTVQSGGTLSPGDSAVGLLTVGALTLNAGANSNFDLGTAGVIGGSTNDLVKVNGALTLGGTLNVNDSGGFGPGAYQLFQYTGALTNNGITVGGVPAAYTTANFTIVTGVAHEIDLVVVPNAGAATTQYWDGTGPANNNQIDGDTGTWTNFGSNFTDSAGATNSTWQNGIAVFMTPANGEATSTVTLSGAINFSGLMFGGGNYTITSDGAAGTSFTAIGLPTNSTNVASISVSNGVTATIDAAIGGTAGISKDGGGTLIYTGSNTYSGGTTINTGVLQIGNGGTSGDLAGDVVDNASFVFNRSDSYSFGGAISGTGTVTQSGSGTLTLTNTTNSYSGGTFVNAGTLSIASDSVLGSTTGGVTLNGGILQATASLTTNRTITLGSTGGTISTSGATQLHLDGKITGTGALILSSPTVGNSAIFLEGTVDNDYTGLTTIAQGYVELNAPGHIALPGDVQINAAGILSINTDEQIAKTSTVTVDGALGFFSSASTVQQTIGTLNGSGTILNFAADSGTLLVNSGLFGGSIVDGTSGGTMGLTKQGSPGSWLFLTGANTYTGPTTINNGVLFVNGSLGNTAVAVNSGGILAGLGTIAGPVTLNSAGIIVPATITGKGGFSLTIGTLTAGSLTWNGGGILGIETDNKTTSLLALTGALTKGTAGTYGVELADIGGTFTQTHFQLVTFGSQNGFTASDFSLLSPGGLNGVFTLKSSELDYDITGITTTGAIIQNSAPINTPTIADFIVEGPVTTGGPTENNQIHTLTFAPGGSLLIHNTLFVMQGPVILPGGSTITLDGSLSVSELKMLFGSLLNGNGNILGNLINGGLVSPGHSPGQIHVSGNYMQSQSGTLLIQIAGRDLKQHDLLSVGGTATLGGALQIVPLDGFKLKRNEPVTFLTAGEGVNGKFATVESGFTSDTILEPTVVYHANSVAFEAVQGSFEKFADHAGLTPNQKSVAQALDSLPTNDHRTNSLLDYLDYRKLNELPRDFDKIAPEELTSMFTIGVSLANVQSQNIQRRNDDIRSGSGGFNAAGLALNSDGPSYSGSFFNQGVAGPSGDDGKEMKETKQVTPEEARWGAFLSGTGQWVSVGNTDNARGYNLDSGGFTLGLDYKVTPNLAIGIAGGYTGTTADLNEGGRVYVNGGKIGLYATFFDYKQEKAAPTMSKDNSNKEALTPTYAVAQGLYADVAVFGGYNSYDTHRSALQGEARGDTDGGELNVLFGTGYDFKKGNLTFGPTASFNYTYVGTNAFTEHGSLAPLDIHGGKGESLRTAFGIKASYDWKVGGVIIKPELRASWQHEYGDAAYALNSSFANGAGNSFLVNGPKLGRDSALLGAGFAIQLSERCSTYFYYDGELGRTNYQSTSVTGGFRLAF